MKPDEPFSAVQIGNPAIPLRNRLLDWSAEVRSAFPPMRVVPIDEPTGVPLLHMTYYMCGRCARKENELPIKTRSERRDTKVPAEAKCLFCRQPANPWSGW